MDECQQPSRTRSLLRVFAAALAGAIGAFGVPAGVHAVASTAPGASTAPLAHSSEIAPD